MRPCEWKVHYGCVRWIKKTSVPLFHPLSRHGNVGESKSFCRWRCFLWPERDTEAKAGDANVSYPTPRFKSLRLSNALGLFQKLLTRSLESALIVTCPWSHAEYQSYQSVRGGAGGINHSSGSSERSDQRSETFSTTTARPVHMRCDSFWSARCGTFRPPTVIKTDIRAYIPTLHLNLHQHQQGGCKEEEEEEEHWALKTHNGVTGVVKH